MPKSLLNRFADSFCRPAPYDCAGLNVGGLRNPYSGLGGPTDKSQASVFTPTLITNPTQLQTIYVESWAAKRFIDLPVEQMFILPREFEGISDEESTVYEKYLKLFEVDQKISLAMRAARLYGSSALILITKEALLTEPLNVKELQRGDLLNIFVAGRYDINSVEYCSDPFDKNYNKIEQYLVTARLGRTFKVHHSRVIRFDGQEPLTSNGWSAYDFYWGVSELIPVLQSIYQEAQAANGASQLIEEASIPVQKIKGFRDILGGAPDAPQLSDLATNLTVLKSIYRTVHMDVDDSFERQEVTFQGLPEIYDRFAKRLAAAANKPATIFWGQSPLGMNATGESDLVTNAHQVKADQNNKLRPVYTQLDKILTRTAGLDITFDYKFPSLLSVSEETQVDNAVKKMQIAVEGVQGDVMSVREARQMLDGDPVIGAVEDDMFDFQAALEQRRAQHLISSFDHFPFEVAQEPQNG